MYIAVFDGGLIYINSQRLTTYAGSNIIQVGNYLLRCVHLTRQKILLIMVGVWLL